MYDFFFSHIIIEEFQSIFNNNNNYYYFIRKLTLALFIIENILTMFIPGTLFNIVSRSVSTSTVCNQIIKLTRLRVVDNSEIGKAAMMEGKPPRCIHVYNKTGVGYIGKATKIC